MISYKSTKQVHKNYFERMIEVKRTDAVKTARTPSNATDCNRTTSPMTSPNSSRKFELGQVVATKGAIKEITEYEMFTALRRHASGDWGDICGGDKYENDFAVVYGGRLFSVYKTHKNTKFWIITEADRSSTTILLPKEY